MSLKNLKTLDLSCNQLQNLQNFEFFNSLQTLYLGYNMITNIENLKQMESLIEIDLEHNMIQDSENFRPLIESSVLIFIIKNNPGTM